MSCWFPFALFVQVGGERAAREFFPQLPLEIPDQGPVFDDLLEIERMVADLETVERLERHAVVLADGAERIVPERQARDVLGPLRKQPADSGDMRHDR